MNVVITGTSRGIGLELTRLALSQGHQVFAMAREPDEAKGLTQLKKDFSGKLTTLAVELRAPEAIKRVGSALATWGHIDLLINNAGIYAKGESLEDFLNSFHVNSVVPYQLTQALLPKLQKGSAPKAVQITSKMGSIADATSGGSYAYRSSKAALNMINRCLSVDNSWLTTIVMHPGWVQTDMGGSSAPVKIEDSAAGIWRVTNAAKLSDSGKFFDFMGKEIPW